MRWMTRTLLIVLGLWLSLPGWAQTVEYIHTDALGTPVAVTDANQHVVERSEYAPYGELLNRPLQDGPGYTGHVQDAATGLTYMQQRYYDPVLGLFLSVDPVTAYSSTLTHFHRYRYANSNPFRFNDPDGRSGCAASRIQSVCENYGMGPRTAIEAGWSQARRERTADAIIARAERRLESRSEGNKFKNSDEAAKFFKGQFAKLSTFLQLEFGAVSEPLANSISGIDRSRGSEFVNGVGLFITLPPVPSGGSEFHTHPALNPSYVGFSGGDLVKSMSGHGSTAYVFYGYPGYQGRKLDVISAKAAGVDALSSEIYAHIGDFHE